MYGSGMASQPKNEEPCLRIEPHDRALFDMAAKAQRETLTQFLVESGRDQAERLPADSTSFSINSEELESLLVALDRPARVRPELREPFARARPE